MANEKDLVVSKESQAEALQLAKARQRPGQTKAQTKLVAQGIEKGIAEYKKRQKILARDRDKQRKKELKASLRDTADTSGEDVAQTSALKSRLLVGLPWFLLVASWIFFAAITSF